ncbi:MAG: hypothetical protein WAV47_24470, partial [Blastocatellia bacterium]
MPLQKRLMPPAVPMGSALGVSSSSPSGYAARCADGLCPRNIEQLSKRLRRPLCRWAPPSEYRAVVQAATPPAVPIGLCHRNIEQLSKRLRRLLC